MVFVCAGELFLVINAQKNSVGACEVINIIH